MPVVVYFITFKCATIFGKKFGLNAIFFQQHSLFTHRVVVASVGDDFIVVGGDSCGLNKRCHIGASVVVEPIGVHHIVVAVIEQLNLIGKHSFLAIKVIGTHN